MFANNAKNSFLGKYGSAPGDLIPALAPSYDQYVRAHASLINYWPLYNDKAGTGETDVVGGVLGTYAGSPTNTSGYLTEGGTTFPSGGRMTTPAINLSRGTVEFWVKIASNPVTSSNKGLFFGLVDSAAKFDKTFHINGSGVVIFSIQVTGTNVTQGVTSTSALPIGRWNHIVGVQDSGNGLQIYINGVLSNTTAVATSASRTDLATGGWLAGTGATLGFVDVPGSYSNLAIYSASLTAADILNHYNAGSTGQPGARVTQSVVEVLRNASTRTARVTQSVVEVLRASGLGYAASGSAALAFTSSAAAVRVFHPSASSTLALSGSNALGTTSHTISGNTTLALATTASAVRDFHRSASSALAVASVETNVMDFRPSASASLVFATAGNAGRSAIYSASAADAVAFAGTGSGFRGFTVSGSSSLTLTGPASEVAAFAVSDSMTLTFSSSTFAARAVRAAAASAVAFTQSEYDHIAQTFSVSGSGALTVSDVTGIARHIFASSTTSIALNGGATGMPSHTINVAGQTTFAVRDSASERAARNYSVNASNTLRVVHFADRPSAGVHVVHAITSLGLGDQADGLAGRNFAVSASSAFGVRMTSRGRDTVILAGAERHFVVTDLASAHAIGDKNVSATSDLGFEDGADLLDLAVFAVSATTRLVVAQRASEAAEFNRAETTTIAFSFQPTAGRNISVSATTGLGLGGGTGSRFQHYVVSASSSLGLHGVGGSGIGSHAGGGTLAMGQIADAALVATGPADDTSLVPGGPANILLSGASGDFPNSYAETPAGLLLIANGIDPMIRWDGLSARAIPAGLAPPASPIQLAGVGVGSIVGRRVAFLRYLDAEGNVSNFSPISNLVDFGRDAGIDELTVERGGVVLIRSDGHGLATGEAIIVGGCDNLPSVNGVQVVSVIDADRFVLAGVVTVGQYQGGGYWTWGVATIVYQNLAAPTNPRVVRRQILRSLDGDSGTFYVDIDTTDLTSPVLSSTADDDALAGGGSVPLFFDDELPAANRFGVPPSHKAVLASHLGRIFATADVAYDTGSAAVYFGSRTVRGSGTEWRATFAGRRLYVAGATTSQEIESVDEANQVITLVAPYGSRTDRFASYAIRSAAGERKLIYYSEPSLPEAWPPWNAVSVPEDSDEITGLLVKGSFLYVLERRHIYRFTFQSDPARDGYIFLSTQRGAINNRCVVQVEDNAYMLDETGVHAFDGGQSSTPISGPIQNLFQQDGSASVQVDWSADQTLWHAAHDPVRDTIRWFVHFVGESGLTHALCYDYRLQRWWVEKYPLPMTASTVATIGYRRSVVGTEARRVLCLSEGALDGVEAQDGLRGVATGGSSTTLVDGVDGFPDGLGGVPITIVSGACKGQTRIIASNTADTIEVVRPWSGGAPDATTTYQIGGVPWTWRSGWFRHAEDEADNPRDIDVVFQPLRDPATLEIAIYYDHSDTPQAWTYTRAEDGISAEEGSPHVSVDLTTDRGYVTYRLKGHNDRYAIGNQFVSLELAGVQAGEVVRVFQVGVNGVAEEGGKR